MSRQDDQVTVKRVVLTGPDLDSDGFILGDARHEEVPGFGAVQ